MNGLRCGDPQLLHRLAGLTVAALALAVTGAGAQPVTEVAGDELFFETVDVDVVNVEVFVTDRKGHPITDLSPEDFELKVDGDPVQITNFYAAVGGRPAQGGAPVEALEVPEESAELVPQPEDQRLFVVIYIDNLHIRSQNRNAVFAALRSWTLDSLRPGDEVMVVTYDGTMDIRQDFATVPANLESVLAEIERDAGRGSEVDADLRLVVSELAETPGGPSFAGGGGDDVFSAQAAQSTLDAVRSYAERTSQRTRASLKGLAQLVNNLSGLEGRKAVLYVSDGLPLRPADALMRAWQNRFSGSAGSAGVSSVEAESLSYDLTADFRRMTQLANGLRVVIHTLDAARLRGLEGVDAGSFNRAEQVLWSSELDRIQTASLQGSLRYLADDTGGRALLGKTNLAEALKGVSTDLDTYYSLGFTPPAGHKNGFHPIRVKVKRKGVQVRHRNGYEARGPEEQIAASTISAAFAKKGGNPLGIALEAEGEQLLDGGTYEVPLLVKVPVGKLVLVPQPDVHQGKVSLFLVARDDEGHVSPVRKVSFPVRIPNAELFTALGQHISYTFKLTLRGGQQTVAVGVRDEVGAVTALTTLELVVPGAES